MLGSSRRARSTRLSGRVALITCAAVAMGLLSAPGASALADDQGAKERAMASLQIKAATDSEKSRGSTAVAPTDPGSSDVSSLKNALAAESTSPVLIVSTESVSAVGSVAAFAKGRHVAVRHQFKTLHALSIQIAAGQTAKSIALFKAVPGVTDVRVAIPRRLLDLPNDPDFTDHQSSYLDAVAAPAAWASHRGSTAVTIAVVDTGVDITHPDLQSKIVGTYNAVDQTSDVTDQIGHGTFVAGVAAAETNNGIGVSGAGYDSKLLAVKIADPSGAMYDDAEAAGIIWAADHGAQIMNLSFGSPDPSSLEKSAIDYAANKGVLIVAAAGNGGADGDPTFYPAAYPDVLAVGATDGTHRATFSEYGSWVDVAAPGVSIYSTTPTAGSSLFDASYATGDGTSFASPLVAGEAALVLAAKPTMSLTDLRAAVVNSAHGFAGLGLGTGRVDFSAAFDHVRPNDTPTITTPLAGGSVSGVVALSASGTGPAVRFTVDGKALGKLITPSAGKAVTSWPTWGLSNGRHTITVAECSISGIECGAAVSMAVVVANKIPSLSSPRAGATISGSFTATASSSGGGLAFYIDGVKRGFDAAAPYSFVYSGSQLTDGRHRLRVVQCSVSGAVCAGPSSSELTFNARSLHPTISSISPSPFSPNGDHRNDVTTFTFHVTETQSASLRIVDSKGATVRGPGSLGTLKPGNRLWTWDGHNNAGHRVADGTYTLVLTTSKASGGIVLRGSTSRPVRSDTAAPLMSAVTGANATFYPHVDGYADAFVPAVTLSEAGRLTLTIRNSKGVVRTIAASKAAGRQTLGWNGRNSANAVVPAGAYSWTLTVADSAGNVRASAPSRVTVSLKALVVKTATLVKNGSAVSSAGASDVCADADKSLSDFYPNGIWLSDACDPGSGDLAAAFYQFTLPAATQYRTARLDAYGNTLFGPTKLRGAFKNTATQQYEITSGAVVSSHANRWYTIGSVNPTGHYDSHRVMTASALITTETGYLSDFDIGQMRLVLTYAVLV